MALNSKNNILLRSLFGFLVVDATVLLIFNMGNFSQGTGGVLFNFFGVLLGSFSAGALWTWFQKESLPNSEKMKLVAGCLFLAVSIDFVYFSIQVSVANSLQLLPVLLVSHVAIGGFVIMGGLHTGNWLVLKRQ